MPGCRRVATEEVAERSCLQLSLRQSQQKRGFVPHLEDLIGHSEEESSGECAAEGCKSKTVHFAAKLVSAPSVVMMTIAREEGDTTAVHVPLFLALLPRAILARGAHCCACIIALVLPCPERLGCFCKG